MICYNNICSKLEIVFPQLSEVKKGQLPNNWIRRKTPPITPQSTDSVTLILFHDPHSRKPVQASIRDLIHRIMNKQKTKQTNKTFHVSMNRVANNYHVDQLQSDYLTNCLPHWQWSIVCCDFFSAVGMERREIIWNCLRIVDLVPSLEVNIIRCLTSWSGRLHTHICAYYIISYILYIQCIPYAPWYLWCQYRFVFKFGNEASPSLLLTIILTII